MLNASNAGGIRKIVSFIIVAVMAVTSFAVIGFQDQSFAKSKTHTTKKNRKVKVTVEWGGGGKQASISAHNGYKSKRNVEVMYKLKYRTKYGKTAWTGFRFTNKRTIPKQDSIVIACPTVKKAKKIVGAKIYKVKVSK